MICDQRERIEARSLDAKLKSTNLNVSFTFSEALAKRSTGRTSTPIESGGRRRICARGAASVTPAATEGFLLPVHWRQSGPWSHS
jgi:hypothetical protein